MPGHDIIVIGASAGGVEALIRLVSGLPKDLPAAIFVVLHIPATSASVLPQILNRSGPLPAAHAVDREAIRHSRIYVAPPDHHLTLHRGYVRVIQGPHENGHRPAIDPLFRTAARFYGPRVIGVVLSGNLDDGTAGLRAIKGESGVAIVQDPDDAVHPSMPRSALEYAPVDFCVPATSIGPLLHEQALLTAAETTDDESADLVQESNVVEVDMDAIENPNRPGVVSGFTCPECNGALWEIRDGELMRYRCRVGHAYTADTLLDEKTTSFESALWAALVALEEKASLTRRMSERNRRLGNERLAEYFQAQAHQATHRAELVRSVIVAEGDGPKPRPLEEVAIQRATDQNGPSVGP